MGGNCEKISIIISFQSIVCLLLALSLVNGKPNISEGYSRVNPSLRTITVGHKDLHNFNEQNKD